MAILVQAPFCLVESGTSGFSLWSRFRARFISHENFLRFLLPGVEGNGAFRAVHNRVVRCIHYIDSREQVDFHSPAAVSP